MTVTRQRTHPGPSSALSWVAVSGCAVIAIAGVLISVPRVFFGHVGVSYLSASAFASFGIVFYALPPTLVLSNVAAHRLGGRRGRRCAAITATVLGGSAVVWWLASRHVSPGHPEFHPDGRVTFSYANIRVRGLLASAVSLSLPAVAAWLLVRPARTREAAVAVHE